MPVIRNFCRIVVGIVFIYSGFVKGVDPLGSAYKFSEYFNAAGLGGMDSLALLASFALSLTEFLVGVALLLNLYTRVAATGAWFYMLFFTPLTLLLALTDPVSDCGCFGDALKLTHWQSFWKNIVLLCLAWVTRENRKSFVSSCSPARQAGLLFLYGAYLLAISIHGYRSIPLLDFRPYAVGKNIAEGMQAPGEAPARQYELTLFYKHAGSGEVKAFTEDNYPWQDTSWTHERTGRKLVQEGYLPPIHDFIIDHPVAGDITREVLEDDRYTLLVVARRVDEVSRDMQAKINRLAYHFLAKGDRVYGLSSSSLESIQAFSDRYRVPYAICSADDTQLKTMIRSTPGLLVLQKGTIIGKWSKRHVPEAAELEDTSVAAYCIHGLHARQENFLVFTLLLLFWCTYLKKTSTRPKTRYHSNI